MPSEDDYSPAPVTPGIFDADREGGPALLGGRCPACGDLFFPRPARCPACLGPVERADLGGAGRLYTYTVVRVKPPWGLPLPYGLGYVDLDGGGPRVLGLLDPAALDRLAIGMPLKLAVGEMGVDLTGRPCLRPYFAPAEGSAQGED